MSDASLTPITKHLPDGDPNLDSYNPLPWNIDDFPNSPPDIDSKWYPFWSIFQAIVSDPSIIQFRQNTLDFLNQQGAGANYDFNKLENQKEYAEYIYKLSPGGLENIKAKDFNIDSFLKFGIITQANQILTQKINKQNEAMKIINRMLDNASSVNEIYHKLNRDSDAFFLEVDKISGSASDVGIGYTTGLLETDLTEDDMKTLATSYNNLLKDYENLAGVSSDEIDQADFSYIRSEVGTMLGNLKPYLETYKNFKDDSSGEFDPDSQKTKDGNIIKPANDRATLESENKLKSSYGWLITGWQNGHIADGAKDLDGTEIKTPPGSSIRDAVTALQNGNDSSREDVRSAMFEFEQFYKIAGSVISQIDQNLLMIGQNIDK
ncbi:MAG: hypothetical protein ACQEP8_00425 [Chlamydiota bacterium]